MRILFAALIPFIAFLNSCSPSKEEVKFKFLDEVRLADHLFLADKCPNGHVINKLMQSYYTVKLSGKNGNDPNCPDFVEVFHSDMDLRR